MTEYTQPSFVVLLVFSKQVSMQSVGRNVTTTKDLRASWLTEVTYLRVNHFIYSTAPFSIMGGKLVGDQINPS